MKDHDSKALQQKEKEKRKLEIAKAYVRLVGQNNLFPTRADLLELGITRDQIRHYFGNISKLRTASKEAFPESFKGLIDIEDYTSEEYKAKLLKFLRRYKRIVITTAVNGQQVDQKALESVENYCDKNKAGLLILPCYDPAHNLDNEIEWHFDEAILDYLLVFDKLVLNSNVSISSIRVTAKQINPTTGLGRFVQGDGSAVFGSPKQSLEYVPVSNIKYPHALMSTGAITRPNYRTTRGNSLRTAFIAEHDHVMGAMIIEIVNDELYHFRPIQFDEEGGFADIGKFYKGKTIKKISPKMVIGDYHAGEHSESAEKAWLELAKLTGTTEVLLHDLHNGLSTNHHDQHKIVTLARRAVTDQLNLRRELGITGSVLNTWTGAVDKVTVIKANHDEFLDRWLEAGTFVKDPYNFQIGCQLADKMVDGADPLVVGVERYGNLKNPNKVNWLNRDQDYKIAGIECGAHGDVGPNGSKGSKANLERAYGRAVIAHSHTPGILRGVFQVGTTSLLKLDYNRGPSSWMHCSCLVYPNGQRQLINAIDGQWHLE